MPGRAYQQNHVGVYRSDNYGDTWNPIHKGLPTDYGFGLALDPSDPETCFTVPLSSNNNYAFRSTSGKFQVFRWNGGGRGWTSVSKGLPAQGAFLNVLRE